MSFNNNGLYKKSVKLRSYGVAHRLVSANHYRSLRISAFKEWSVAAA